MSRCRTASSDSSSSSASIVPIFVSNTVFVDELYGNDATGQIERRDLPYRTRPAALAAAQGMSPTLNKRIMIIVDNVFSSTPLELSNFIDYDLSGGSIVVTTGASAAIDDNNDACNSVVYGADLIMKTGGTNNFGLRTQNASTLLVVYAKQIMSSADAGASIEGGIVDLVNCRVVTIAANENALEKSGGTLILDTCTLIATGTGNSIFSSTAQAVKIYGGYQSNKSKHANIIFQGNPEVVSANII